MSKIRLQELVRRFEWPMALLALLVIPVLVLEDRATTPELREAAVIINWVIWLAFKNIRRFGDALWWAITTVTTVGYGDITP